MEDSTQSTEDPLMLRPSLQGVLGLVWLGATYAIVFGALATIFAQAMPTEGYRPVAMVVGIALIGLVGLLVPVAYATLILARTRLVLTRSALSWRDVRRWHEVPLAPSDTSKVRIVGWTPFRQALVLIPRGDDRSAWLDLRLWRTGDVHDALTSRRLLGGSVTWDTGRLPRRGLPTASVRLWIAIAIILGIGFVIAVAVVVISWIQLTR